MKAPLILLTLALAAGLAAAQAPPPTRVAMQVTAAHKAGKPLDKLANVPGVDPWKVAHELRMRGKLAEARAYAQAVRIGGGDALRKYLDSIGDRAPDPAGAKAVAECNRRSVRGDFKGALAALEGVVVPGVTITATRFAVARGASLIRLGRADEGVKALAQGAALAQQLGWEFVVALERLTVARLALQRDPRKALEAATEALAIRERLGDPVELTETLVVHAELLARTGDFDAADKDLARALEVSKGLSLHPQIGTSLYHALGNRALQSRNLKDAVRYYELELPLRRAIGDRTGLAAVQVNLGMAYVGVGEYEKAVPHLEQGRRMAQFARRTGWVKNALGNLANAYKELGKDRKAIEANRALLKLIGPTGNERSAVIAYEQIAFLELRGGNIAGGTKAGNAMIALWMQLGDKLGAADAITRIAAAHGRAGDGVRADALMQQALSLDPDGSPSRLALAGFCAARVGDETRALSLVQEARTKAEATGDEQLIAAVLLDYATVVAQFRGAKVARPHFERALGMVDANAHPVLATRLNAALAQADLEEFDFASARTRARRVLAALPADAPGAAETRTKMLQVLGQAQGRLGDLVRAQATLEEAVALARGLRKPRGLAATRAALGSVRAQGGEYCGSPHEAT
jgi:tetratricopeptide (TPR) repeat protein